MTRSKTKIYLCRFLFTLYFIIFAFSPLTYAYTKSHPDKSFIADTTNNVSSINVLFLDLLCSSFNSLEKQDHAEDSPSGRFLLKKKRAIISTNDELKLIQSDNLVIIEKYLSLPVCPSVATKFPQNIQNQKALNGFRLLYTGLSPPSL